MNRRSYLKGILVFGTVAVTSFSVFEWFSLNKTVNPEDFFKKRAVLAELTELIIPETDTPGAKQAGVNEYIINVMVNCYPFRLQHKFLDGINDFERYTESTFNKKFLDCSFAEKNRALAYFERKSGFSNRIVSKINNKIFGEPFFSKLKNLTVEGYCLSQPGATRGLAYDYIPGSYQACIPLSVHQKSWATK